MIATVLRHTRIDNISHALPLLVNYGVSHTYVCACSSAHSHLEFRRANNAIRQEKANAVDLARSSTDKRVGGGFIKPSLDS